MSDCRCDEIKVCREKIRKLQNVLNRFRMVDHYIDLINNQESEASSAYSSAFESVKNSDLCTDTEDIDLDMKSVRGDISSRINQRISELQSDLSDMEDEDERYHEHHDHHH